MNLIIMNKEKSRKLKKIFIENFKNNLFVENFRKEFIYRTFLKQFLLKKFYSKEIFLKILF